MFDSIPVKKTILLLLLMLPTIGLLSQSEEEEEEEEIHPFQFFILADSLVEDDTLAAYLEEVNATVAWSEAEYPVELWEVTDFPFTTPGGQVITDIQDALNLTRKKSKIKSACGNSVQNIAGEVSFGSQTSCFKISDYAFNQGSNPIKISIIDTGIDDGIGENSNDSMDFNIIEYSGYDYVHNDPVPDDENGHGTHLAGLIHAITQAGLIGDNRISFDIRKTHDSNGQAFMSDIIIAVFDAIASGADIINMSFGYEDVFSDTMFFPLRIAMEEAFDQNVLIFAAAGNDTQDNDDFTETTLPASFPDENLVSVHSLDCNDHLSFFTNYGKTTVDVAVLAEDVPGPSLLGGLEFRSGTSQATAIASALAAIKGTLQFFEPDQVKCQMIGSKTHLTQLADQNIADGKLNFQDFINATSCVTPDCDEVYVGDDALMGVAPTHQIIEIDSALQSSQVITQMSHSSYDALGGSELLQGFEVEAGANFLVLVDGCNH